MRRQPLPEALMQSINGMIKAVRAEYPDAAVAVVIHKQDGAPITFAATCDPLDMLDMFVMLADAIADGVMVMPEEKGGES